MSDRTCNGGVAGPRMLRKDSASEPAGNSRPADVSSSQVALPVFRLRAEPRVPVTHPVPAFAYTCAVADDSLLWTHKPSKVSPKPSRDALIRSEGRCDLELRIALRRRECWVGGADPSRWRSRLRGRLFYGISPLGGPRNIHVTNPQFFSQPWTVPEPRARPNDRMFETDCLPRGELRIGVHSARGEGEERERASRQ